MSIQAFAGAGPSNHTSVIATEPLDMGPGDRSVAKNIAEEADFSVGESLKSLCWGGVKNMAKGLLSPQGLGMVAAGVAVSFLSGGLATPWLIGAGLGLSCWQGIKCATKAIQAYQISDADQYHDALAGVGCSLIGVGLSCYGARSYYRNLAQAKLLPETEAVLAMRDPVGMLSRDMSGHVSKLSGAGQMDAVYGVLGRNLRTFRDLRPLRTQTSR